MEVPAWHVLVVQVLTFLVGAGLLWGIAIKPIRGILDERRRRIETAQAEAAALKIEAEEIRRELQSRLDRLAADAAKRAKAADAAAQKLRADVVAAAREEARAVLAEGRAQVARERAAMRATVQRDVARLSVAMARKVAAASLTAPARKRLFKKVLDELPKRLEGSA